MRTNSFVAQAAFIVDRQSVDRSNGRQIDWANVPNKFRATAVKVTLTANAVVDAVSLTVGGGILAPIPQGSVIDFGGKKVARTTADVAAGAVAIPVSAVGVQINNGDVGYYGGVGAKTIPPGTVMAEMASGKIVPRSDRPGGETAVGLLETTASGEDPVTSVISDAKSGYGVVIGGVIYENLLPDATGSPKVLPGGYKTELQTAGVGTGFAFRQYADDRT